jgi:uncharacterized protein (TIGR03435 family)
MSIRSAASAAFLAVTLIAHAAVVVATLPTAAAAQVQTSSALEGTWQGAVRQPDGSDTRWVVKIEKTNGAWKGTLWFIDQRSPAIPIDKVTLNSGTMSLDIGTIGITYEGKVAADGKTIAGTRTAGDNKAPLVFTRATPTTEWAIPDPPPPDAKMDPKAFEVATIKPQDPNRQDFAFLLNHGSFIGRGLTVEKLMTISLRLNSAQIVGLPEWARQDKFDIEAKSDTPGEPSLQQFFDEVSRLVVERFGLKYHMEKREMTAYSLAVARGGFKMKPSPAGFGDIPGFGLPPGQLIIRNATMNEFCGLLQSDVLDHPVVDQTGLGGTRYGGALKYQMDDAEAAKRGLAKAPQPPDGSEMPPPLITALTEQFGLKLEAGKLPVDVIVVDSVSKPSPN